MQAKNQGQGAADFHGVVDCYQDLGMGSAIFSGRITKFTDDGTNPNPRDAFFEIAVVDNGEPGSTDMISTRRRGAGQGQFNCETDTFRATQPLTSGNLQVHGQSS